MISLLLSFLSVAEREVSLVGLVGVDWWSWHDPLKVGTIRTDVGAIRSELARFVLNVEEVTSDAQQIITPFL